MEEFAGKQPKRRMARKMGLDEPLQPPPPRAEEKEEEEEEEEEAVEEQTRATEGASTIVAWCAASPSPGEGRSEGILSSSAATAAQAEESESQAPTVAYGDPIAAAEAAILLQAALRRLRATREAAKRRKGHASRINISAELLETEKNYVRQLKVLSSCYLVPLKTHGEVLGKELSLHLVSLLGTVEVIVAYHEDFLQHITERVEGHWDYSSKLGDVFLQMAAYLKSYTQYVAPYQTAVRLLALRKEDEELQVLLESLKAPECNGKGLKDLLIMPVQRIPRYNMILSDLKKNTWPDHRDYGDLCEAAARVLDIANHVETMSAEGERLEKKLEIASLVKFPKGEEITLAAAHRRFLFDYRVDVRQTVNGVEKNRTLQLFAFSDLILLCTPSKSGKDYKALTHVNLAGCKHSMVPNPDDGDMCLLIHTSKGEILIRDNATSVVSSLSKLISENSSSLNHTKEAGDRTMVPVSPQKCLEPPRAESPSAPKGRLRRSLSFKSMKGMVQKQGPSTTSLAPSSPLNTGGHSPSLKRKTQLERKTSGDGQAMPPASSPKFGKLKKRLRSQSTNGGSLSSAEVRLAAEPKQASLRRSKGSPSASRRNPTSPSGARKSGSAIGCSSSSSSGIGGGSPSLSRRNSASKVRKARSFQHRDPGRDEIVQVDQPPPVVLDRQELEVEMVRVMKKIAQNEMSLRSSSDLEKMDLLTSTAELKVKLGELKRSLMSSCSSGDEGAH